MGQEVTHTIAAVSTPAGSGGIAVVRMSGPEATEILARCWKGGDITAFRSHTVHLGIIIDAEGFDVDQVLVSLFKGPNSFTGEDIVEISCHGSPWIQQSILHRLVECGAHVASAGEFTRRAFMNGRLDLAQAEGVADLIAASSRAAARLANSQLRGDFSRQLEQMRQKLIDLGSLLELELDFSEEEVEFADRGTLISLTCELRDTVNRLASSFKAGNAFKNGIPVAIAGIPNAGKSTLLNALLGEEKAIVSDIPGTTRDIIEDTAEISGILFRFFDTAGLRQTDDAVETIGVDRARRKIGEAAIVIHLLDPTRDIESQLSEIDYGALSPDTKVVTLLTKSDITDPSIRLDSRETFSKLLSTHKNTDSSEPIEISAMTGKGLDMLRSRLLALATDEYDPQQDLIVTNARHYEALNQASDSLERLIEGLYSGVSADFLAQDLREATHHLGTITGTVTSDELLQTIFARYCIGK